MRKGNHYTKLILDRLTRKEQPAGGKDDHSSQKTQATPNDSSGAKTDHIRGFFEQFENNCAVYHEQVNRPPLKPLRRKLFFDLEELRFSNRPQRHSRVEKMVTMPSVSPFTLEARKTNRPGIKQVKDNRSSITLRDGDRPGSTLRTQPSSSVLSRYRSLKPVSSCIYLKKPTNLHPTRREDKL